MADNEKWLKRSQGVAFSWEAKKLFALFWNQETTIWKLYGHNSSRCYIEMLNTAGYVHS